MAEGKGRQVREERLPPAYGERLSDRASRAAAPEWIRAESI